MRGHHSPNIQPANATQSLEELPIGGESVQASKVHLQGMISLAISNYGQLHNVRATARCTTSEGSKISNSVRPSDLVWLLLAVDNVVNQVVNLQTGKVTVRRPSGSWKITIKSNTSRVQNPSSRKRNPQCHTHTHQSNSKTPYPTHPHRTLKLYPLRPLLPLPLNATLLFL